MAAGAEQLADDQDAVEEFMPALLQLQNFETHVDLIPGYTPSTQYAGVCGLVRLSWRGANREKALRKLANRLVIEGVRLHTGTGGAPPAAAAAPGPPAAKRPRPEAAAPPAPAAKSQSPRPTQPPAAKSQSPRPTQPPAAKLLSPRPTGPPAAKLQSPRPTQPPAAKSQSPRPTQPPAAKSPPPAAGVARSAASPPPTPKPAPAVRPPAVSPSPATNGRPAAEAAESEEAAKRKKFRKRAGQQRPGDKEEPEAKRRREEGGGKQKKAKKKQDDKSKKKDSKKKKKKKKKKKVVSSSSSSSSESASSSSGTADYEAHGSDCMKLTTRLLHTGEPGWYWGWRKQTRDWIPCTLLEHLEDSEEVRVRWDDGSGQEQVIPVRYVHRLHGDILYNSDDGKHRSCGLCKSFGQWADADEELENMLFCCASRSFRSKECLRIVHCRCQGLAAPNQIPENELYLCRECFTGFCDEKERSTMIEYLIEHEERLRAIALGQGTLCRGVVDDVLTQAPRDCYDVHFNLSYEEDFTKICKISPYSFLQIAAHKMWFRDLCADAWPAFIKQHFPPKGGGDAVEKDDVLVIGDSDSEEEKAEQGSAGTLRPAPAWQPLIVERIRLWRGEGATKNADGGWQFVTLQSGGPSSPDEVWENPQCEQSTVVCYLCPSKAAGAAPDELDLALFPCAVADEVLRIPLSTIGPLAIHGDRDCAAYLRLAVTEAEGQALVKGALKQRELAKAVLRKQRKPRQRPNPSVGTVLRKGPVGAPKQGGGAVYLSVLLRTPLLGSKAGRALHKLELGAFRSLIEGKCPDALGKVSAAEKQGHIAAEMKWMQAPMRRPRSEMALLICGEHTPKLRVTVAEYARLGPPVSTRSYLNDILIDWDLAQLQTDRVRVFPAAFASRARSFYDNSCQGLPPPDCAPADNKALLFATAQGSSRKVSLGWVVPAPQPSLLDSDLLLIPVNDHSRKHWVLAAVGGLKGAVTGGPPAWIWLCDSLRRDGVCVDRLRFMPVVCRFLAYRAIAERWMLREQPQSCRWTVEHAEPAEGWWKAFCGDTGKGGRLVTVSCPPVPQQANNYDCGIHVIMTAHKLAKRAQKRSDPPEPTEVCSQQGIEVYRSRKQLFLQRCAEECPSKDVEESWKAAVAERKRVKISDKELRAALDRVDQEHQSLASSRRNSGQAPREPLQA